jgi:FkbM family methyltransferase
MRAPPKAKLVGGVWLPANETHFEDWMRNSKRARTVDGRLTYQYHKLEAAMRRQPPERRRVCLDIGAHVGLWSMWLARAFERVQAFEPVPAFADIFPFNVSGENVTLHRVALGDGEGTVSITVPEGETGNAHVAIEGKHPGTRYGSGGHDTWHGVPLRRLDSFGLTRVDFIKIDVEGFERQVIAGAEQTIKTCKPNMVIEQKGNESAYGEPRDAGRRLLESWGMRSLDVLSGDHIMGWPAVAKAMAGGPAYRSPGEGG